MSSRAIVEGRVAEPPNALLLDRVSSPTCCARGPASVRARRSGPHMSEKTRIVEIGELLFHGARPGHDARAIVRMRVRKRYGRTSPAAGSNHWRGRLWPEPSDTVGSKASPQWFDNMRPVKRICVRGQRSLVGAPAPDRWPSTTDRTASSVSFRMRVLSAALNSQHECMRSPLMASRRRAWL